MAEFAQHQFSVFTSSKESQKGVLCARGSQTFSSLWAEHFAMLRARDLVAWWFWTFHHLLIICSSFAHHLPHFFWRPNHTKSTCRTSLSHAPCLKTSAVLRWWSSETGSGLRHLGCISPFTNLMVRRKGRIMGNPSWFSGMVWSQGMVFFCDFSLLFPCWFAKLRTSKKLPMLLYRCHLTVLCWCFDRISHFFFENWFDFTGILGWEHQGFLEIFPSTNLLMACSIIFSVVPQIITLW